MVIATRILTVATPDGEKSVSISIYQPERDGTIWVCRYEIDWPEGRVKSRAGGSDGPQALELALEKIGMELHMSRYHHERRMWWMKPYVGYGFPMPKQARDLFIGDDAKYDG